MTREDRAVADEPETDDERRGPAAERMPNEKHDGSTPLFARDDAERYRSRWQEVQAGFVDEPRRSVEAADTLVGEVIQKLATVFADQQKQIESQLERSGKMSTEDMRVALQRYRSFFDRLLSV